MLEALADDKLQRGTRWGDQGKPGVFTHLIRTSLPAEGDTPEAFAARMKAAGIADDRLVEVAVYAPQWAAHVEQRAPGWDGFEESVWWLHAHTTDDQWGVEEEVKREAGTAQVGAADAARAEGPARRRGGRRLVPPRRTRRSAPERWDAI